MKQIEEIIGLFTDIVVLKIDLEGNISKVVINTNQKFNISKIKNVYDIFTRAERFRLKRVLESGFDIRKKYMELSTETGVKDFVDIKIYERDYERDFFLQFFESSRDREVSYDRYIEKLTNLAEKDPLTKVLNRKGLQEKVKQLVKTGDKKRRLGIISLDMDDLKGINYTYGHKMGDKAILKIIDILLANTRERDIVARLGGDEFLIVTEEVSGSESTAYGLAKRLLLEISKKKTEKHFSTVSMGVHVVQIGEILGETTVESKDFIDKCEKELDKADKALYKSKKNGKNQVSVSKEFLKFYEL